MTSEEKKWVERWEAAMLHPWPFIRDFVCTFDNHDMTEIAARKPAPQKVYIRAITRAWMETDVMLAEKSRQIWMTWLFCALYLWMAMKPAKLVFFQSKNQGDANEVLVRAKHIYSMLLRWKKVLPGLPIAKMTGQKIGTTDSLEFPDIISKIWAIPQGPEVVASYTISGLLADEMDLQVQWLDGYSRAMPAISGGGKYTAIGSANGKTPAWRMLYDIDARTQKTRAPFLEDSDAVRDLIFRPPNQASIEDKRYFIERELLHLSDKEFNSIPLVQLFAHLPGMRYWITADSNNSNNSSMRIHYTADPDKDPVTKNGRVWVRAEKERMRYNSNKPFWDREYEIRRTSFLGRAVIGNWDPHIFIPEIPGEFDYDDREPLHIGIDFGTIQCNAIFSQLVRIPGSDYRQVRIIDEIILRNSNTPALADALLAKLKEDYKPAWSNGRFELYVDPAGNQGKETTSDNSERNSIEIFQNCGLYVVDIKLGLRESTEHLETVFMTFFKVDGKKIPAIVVHPRCIKCIEAYEGGLHYPEKEIKDGHYEKDGEYDHIGDASRYLLSNIIDPDMLAIIPEETYRWTYYKVRQKNTGRVLSVQKVRVAG